MMVENEPEITRREERRRLKNALRAKRFRRAKKKARRYASRYGFVPTDAALINAIVRRRRALGLSQLALDQITGLPDGYQGKIECGMKNPGLKSLSLILQALGLGIVLVPGEAPRITQAIRPKRQRRA